MAPLGRAASTAPLAPRNLTLNRSGGCPYLLWELTGADARGSRVEKSADGVNFAQYHTYPYPSNPSPYSVYTDHGAGEYGTFYYHVRAYNAWGDSPPSNAVSIYVPPPPAVPSNLTATTISNGPGVAILARGTALLTITHHFLTFAATPLYQRGDFRLLGLNRSPEPEQHRECARHGVQQAVGRNQAPLLRGRTERRSA